MRRAALVLAIAISGCAGTNVRPLAYVPRVAVPAKVADKVEPKATDASKVAAAKVTEVQSDVEKGVEGYSEAETNGIRYYEGAWFIIVFSDGKGGLKSEAKFLPDLRRKLAIDPFSVLAKNETTLNFSNGILTQGKSVVDEAVIPKTALAAFEKVALAQASAFNKADEDEKPTLPLPMIYKVSVDEHGKLALIRGETRILKDGVFQDGTLQSIVVTPQPADGAAQ